MFQVGDRVIMVNIDDLNEHDRDFAGKPCTIKEVDYPYYRVKFAHHKDVVAFYQFRFRRFTKLDKALK